MAGDERQLVGLHRLHPWGSWSGRIFPLFGRLVAAGATPRTFEPPMPRHFDGDVVYSSRGADVCPRCGEPKDRCRCRSLISGSASTGAGNVRIGRETAGRKGAGVTVVTGLKLSPAELLALAKEWKRRFGTGGTVRKDGAIELAGEHRDALVADLIARGIAAKRAGG